MIDSMQILNFQSWATGEFGFHPGVNVIHGDSDGGKSASLRAFRWAAENRPSGDSFRSWWGGQTIVDIETDESFSIARVKGGKVATTNEYNLTNNELEDVTFKAMGANVPAEVAETLDMDETNFQWQHDPLFLLSETGGEVARRLNRVAKLDLIDTSLAAVDSAKRQNTSDVKAAKATVEQTEETLATYDYLPDLEVAVCRLEEKQQRAGDIEKMSNGLMRAADEVGYAQELLDRCADYTGAEKRIEALDKRRVAQEAVQRSITVLEGACDEIVQTRELLEDAAELAAAGPALAELTLKINRRNGITKELTILMRVDENIVQAVVALDKTTRTELNALSEWDEKAKGACPLCDGKGEL